MAKDEPEKPKSKSEYLWRVAFLRQSAVPPVSPQEGKHKLPKISRPSAEDTPGLPDLSFTLYQLQEALREWSATLGTDSYYTSEEYDESGPNDFGYWLRRSTEDNLRKAISVLEVTKGTESARALEDRFQRLYDDAKAYDKLLEDLEEQSSDKMRQLVKEYQEKVAPDEASLWRECQGPDRVFRINLPDLDKPPETVFDYAEAIDAVHAAEIYRKQKEQYKMRKTATDLADHVGVIEAFLPDKRSGTTNTDHA